MKPDAWQTLVHLRPDQAHRLVRLVFFGMGLPLVAFILFSVFWPKPTPPVTRIPTAERWIEPLGNLTFDEAHLTPLLQRKPDLAHATWQAVEFPDTTPLPASVDLPTQAPVARVWFRIQLPPGLADPDAGNPGGTALALMGNRIMGGPWAVWRDGQLVQTNAADWRIGWNIPLRAPLGQHPAGQAPGEVLLAVIYPQAKGYAVGSLFAGPADAIEVAWRARYFWMFDVGYIATGIALALLLITLHLLYSQPQDRSFQLLSAAALFWLATGWQYIYDMMGYPQWSFWYGWAVDASINWVVAFNLLVYLELCRIAAPRLQVALLAYAGLSTVVTMPLWQWEKSALMAQIMVNVVVYAGCLIFVLKNAVRNPTRERTGIAIVNLVFLAAGIHDTWYLTGQGNPDHVFTYQLGAILTFAMFMYVSNRRYLQALHASQRHRLEMQEKLLEQEQQLAAQHQALRAVELKASRAAWHHAITLDLHDRVGSHITSGIHQVRSGSISQDEMLFILQDIGNEVRNLVRLDQHAEDTVASVLADLRERIEPRLRSGSIALRWQVAPDLQAQPLSLTVADNLRAMLQEAIANAIRHAHPDHITLRATTATPTNSATQPGQPAVSIEITDDGQGFNPATTPKGRGLDGMHFRAHAIGAHLHIHSEPGKGTVVSILKRNTAIIY